MTSRLILLRHGQSIWNERNLFTGWADVPVSEKGLSEAHAAGSLLARFLCQPDILYTSLLRRSITTANVALEAAERYWVPVKRSWRLNERHYGSLQGRSKTQMAEEVGDEQVAAWRRSYSAKPPPLSPKDHLLQEADPRYAATEVSTPLSESLEDVVSRLRPYWVSDIVPDLLSRKTVLVVAHGNSLRALVKIIDGLSDDDITKVEIPTGTPILYEFDLELNPLNKGGRQLHEPCGGCQGIVVL